jgi:tRNA pseudouridine32 synthase/23S rRNA pseudouridine746 synthase
MLEGLPVEPPPVFESAAPPVPRTVYEDDAIWVIDKPAGLLSVPGRRAQPTVLSRLGRDDVRPAHRLDLDTSGILVLAKREADCIALQRQFARRTVFKRYVALLAGEVPGAQGQIELALRADRLDRPRQVHHPDGRAAITRWTRLEADRVALFPQTGRTHQLRVHCAHPLGLGVPIRGDRLYGTEGERLYLHAEAIGFDHPVTGRRIKVMCPAPF